MSNNRELIKTLKMMIENPGPQSIFVWGKQGSGRSHLSQALYQEAEVQNIKAAYLALSEEGIEPEILSQLEHYSLVILDDLDVDGSLTLDGGTLDVGSNYSINVASGWMNR